MPRALAGAGQSGMVQVLVVIGFGITVYLPNGENFVITFAGTTFTTTMDLHLTDEQAELDRIIEDDRFPLSRRIVGRVVAEVSARQVPTNFADGEHWVWIG